ncbi:sensor histidine kinase [Pseudoalteromonas denitrificans]|nr:HAMP domain-containing sensor histidine kinase [Pseudoalteromonas denitrificans]
MAAFERGLLQIEAVRLEDYNQYAKPEFEKGKVGEFHQELKTLSEQLLTQKSRYDQHAFLVYQLIDQLNTPILVFNQKNQLAYANGAFTLLYEQPWQMYRHASLKLLGLTKKDNNWQLDADKHHNNQQWQISQSEFIDNAESNLLLVFTNIESALRLSQQNAWQQIIRVMGHEIRNSLTPVSSLAESLVIRSESERDQKALAVISERCHHLQDFISRYSFLSQKLNLNCQQLRVNQFIERLKGLFSGLELQVSASVEWLWADQAFLEQVLINLIKNANEAGADKIAMTINEIKGLHLIQVIDNGHGFANFDNLFVPLFTTKQKGQGIGLSFCRNIIEQHEGSIELINNTDAGVTVSINLPIK